MILRIIVLLFLSALSGVHAVSSTPTLSSSATVTSSIDNSVQSSHSPTDSVESATTVYPYDDATPTSFDWNFQNPSGTDWNDYQNPTGTYGMPSTPTNVPNCDEKTLILETLYYADEDYQPINLTFSGDLPQCFANYGYDISLIQIWLLDDQYYQIDCLNVTWTDDTSKQYFACTIPPAYYPTNELPVYFAYNYGSPREIGTFQYYPPVLNEPEYPLGKAPNGTSWITITGTKLGRCNETQFFPSFGTNNFFCEKNITVYYDNISYPFHLDFFRPLDTNDEGFKLKIPNGRGANHSILVTVDGIKAALPRNPIKLVYDAPVVTSVAKDENNGIIQIDGYNFADNFYARRFDGYVKFTAKRNNSLTYLISRCFFDDTGSTSVMLCGEPPWNGITDMFNVTVIFGGLESSPEAGVSEVGSPGFSFSNQPPLMNMVQTQYTMNEDTSTVIELLATDPDPSDILAFYLKTLPQKGKIYSYDPTKPGNKGSTVYESNLQALIPSYDQNADDQTKIDESRALRIVYVPNADANGEDEFEVYVSDSIRSSDPPVKIKVTIIALNDAPRFDKPDITVTIPQSAIAAGFYDFQIEASDVDTEDTTILFKLEQFTAIVRHLDVARDGASIANGVTAFNPEDSTPSITFTANDGGVGGASTALINKRQGNGDNQLVSVRKTNDKYLLSVNLKFGKSGGISNPFMTFSVAVQDFLAASLTKLTVMVNVECPQGTVPNVWSFGNLCAACPLGGVCSDDGSFMPYNLYGYAIEKERQGIFFPCSPSSSCLAGNATDSVQIQHSTTTNSLLFTRSGSTINSNDVSSPNSFYAAYASLTSSCSVGYSGDRCSECTKRYYRLNGSCTRCPESTLSISAIIAIIAVSSIVGVALYLWISSLNLDFGNLFIGITFFQVLSLFVDFPEIEWPDQVLTIFSAAKSLMLDINFFAPECFVDSGLSYEFKFKLVLAVPIIVTVNLVLAFLLYAIFELLLRPLLNACGLCIAPVDMKQVKDGYGSQPVPRFRIDKSAPFDENPNNIYQRQFNNKPGYPSNAARMSLSMPVQPGFNYNMNPIYGRNSVAFPNNNNNLSPDFAIDFNMPREQDLGIDINDGPQQNMADGMNTAKNFESNSRKTLNTPRDRIYWFGIKLIGLWMTFLDVSYLTLFMKSIQIYNCRAPIGADDSLGLFIFGEPNKQCYTESWYSELLPFSILGIVFYAFGIIALSVGVLRNAYYYSPDLEFPKHFAFGVIYRKIDKAERGSLVSLIKRYRKNKLEKHKVTGDGGGVVKRIGSREVLDSLSDINALVGPAKESHEDLGVRERVPWFGQICVDVISKRKNDFVPSFVFWSVVVLLRKALISVTVSLITDRDAMKIISLQAIFALALVLQLLSRPYRRYSWNRLEETIFFCLQMILTTAMAFQAGTTSGNPALREGLGYLIVLLVGICSLIIVWMTLTEFKKYWKDFMRRYRNRNQVGAPVAYAPTSKVVPYDF